VTIRLITGNPGAGKTTYAVAEVIQPEAGRKITLDSETCLLLGYELGTVIERRIVCAGVRGLKLDHERLPHILTRDPVPASVVDKFNAYAREPGGAVSDVPEFERLPNQPPLAVDPIVENWWCWCKPGDLIIVDEAQFVAPRASLGKKPPVWIAKLAIHRHYGVDFLFITQHPGLIATEIRALVGFHQHVRSVMGTALCLVYAWDHASNPERYTLATKSKFLRRAKHYALFHSSVAHVAPPSSGRWALWLAPLLLVGAFVGFRAWEHKMQHHGPSPGATASPGVVGSVSAASAASAPALYGPASLPVQGRRLLAGYVDVPALAGCIAVGDACRCYAADDGRDVPVDDHACRLSSRSYAGLVPWRPQWTPPPRASDVPEPAAAASAPAPVVSSSHTPTGA
jgi:hypothetical protein